MVSSCRLKRGRGSVFRCCHVEKGRKREGHCGLSLSIQPLTLLLFTSRCSPLLAVRETHDVGAFSTSGETVINSRHHQSTLHGSTKPPSGDVVFWFQHFQAEPGPRGGTFSGSHACRTHGWITVGSPPELHLSPSQFRRRKRDARLDRPGCV